MKTRTLLVALALAVSPGLALAGEGCSYGDSGSEDVVMSCAEGSTYDSEAGRCVPTTG